ncbi:P27 family phage terminase small subunit [Sphingomonas qomolangmaensis]|uniref:P27 family phage terminase small subunit n=1 Tax=Sphingomonas qomolangmaensis TaxID=2918765 RepID=A0ABY5L5J8_9SPHN|nr:P27 family phage terminase small subunit [Sphingomonas qomolangmaensis]UUL82228.1 P27 family phage terminase small subunit [Sphingomonas qomolangmaensis]
MNVVTLDPQPADLPEPDWQIEFPGQSKLALATRTTASRYWGTVVRELRGANKLAVANAHAIKRLVLAWMIYDRAALEVARSGPIVPAPKTKTPMHNPWFTAMTQAGKTAASIEAELTITPRSRDAGGELPAPPRRATPADRFLRPMDGGSRLPRPGDEPNGEPDAPA